MKSVKSILVAATILAVAGGALAFKAKTLNAGNIFTPNPDNQAVCDVPAPQLTHNEVSFFEQISATYDAPGACVSDIPVTTDAE